MSCSTLIVNPSEVSGPKLGLAVINVDICFDEQSAAETPAAAQAT